MNYIEITNLNKSFGKTQALKSVNFSVAQGEIFGYLGPNGAGKTTTISCLMDLIRADSGQIIVNGLDSKKDSIEIKRLVGFVPTDTYFFSNWTGSEHIEYIEKIKGKTSLKTKLIKDFDYNPKLKIHSLSTGNRQKLALIIAMMHSPQLLVLDEPTRGLDPLLQNVFYEYLRTLQSKGSTIFMSSHNLAEVENICSKVAIIKTGEIVEVADVESLQDKSIYIINAAYVDKPNIDKHVLAECKIEMVHKHDNRYEFKVAGDINKALKLVSQNRLKEIKIAKASLEDIFLEFYK